MAAVINTNIASLNAQRSLSSSQGALNTSLQRLSSGLRINSSKDDSAGLAIATRMDSQIRGQQIAVRNANDGISLSQTAEGALSSVTNSLQRMRELAVQSSNSTNTSVDREALNSEVAQLQAEIQRVAEQTSFNGTKLIDGSFTGAKFQVGANAGQTIDLSTVSDVTTSKLGRGYTSTVTGTAATTVGTTNLGAIAAGTFKINGEDVGVIAATTSGGTAAQISLERGTAVATAINAISNKTGVTAAVDSAGLVTLSKTGDVSGTDASGNAVTGASTSEIIITGTVANTGLTAATTAASSVKNDATAISKGDIKTYDNAQNMIKAIDRALSEVNTDRAKLGAVQNRFESVISNLNVSVENLSASKSRIVDADFAAETAQLTRGQILQQAGTAMLAQANSLPNNVLSLLRG